MYMFVFSQKMNSLVWIYSEREGTMDFFHHQKIAPITDYGGLIECLMCHRDQNGKHDCQHMLRLIRKHERGYRYLKHKAYSSGSGIVALTKHNAIFIRIPSKKCFVRIATRLLCSVKIADLISTDIARTFEKDLENMVCNPCLIVSGFPRDLVDETVSHDLIAPPISVRCSKITKWANVHVTQMNIVESQSDSHSTPTGLNMSDNSFLRFARI